jgi:NAD(P)-dependent dehydrogenase (short-subunit alcohol dehydrogenase family)
MSGGSGNPLAKYLFSALRLPQDLTSEEWHQVMEVNLTSAFLLSKAVYPHLKQVGGGKIVNIGSMTSYFEASYASPYATSKGHCPAQQEPGPGLGSGQQPGQCALARLV